MTTTQQQQQQPSQPTSPTTTTKTSMKVVNGTAGGQQGIHQLREIRRTFIQHKLEHRPAVELWQYGNVTLIHRKLDSWIDAKPELYHHYTWNYNDSTNVLKLDGNDEDHRMRRFRSLAKNKNTHCHGRGGGRFAPPARSWSGNINLIQRDSLIDTIPTRAAAVAMELVKKYPQSETIKKRTKPRRVSGAAILKVGSPSASRRLRSNSHPSNSSNSNRNDGTTTTTCDDSCCCTTTKIRAKDILLDGDLQTIRKAVLERKLCLRPWIPNANNEHEWACEGGLVAEIQKQKQALKEEQEEGNAQYYYHHQQQQSRTCGSSSSSSSPPRCHPLCRPPSRKIVKQLSQPHMMQSRKGGMMMMGGMKKQQSQSHIIQQQQHYPPRRIVYRTHSLNCFGRPTLVMPSSA